MAPESGKTWYKQFLRKQPEIVQFGHSGSVLISSAEMFIKLFYIFSESEKVIADIGYHGVLALDLPYA